MTENKVRYVYPRLQLAYLLQFAIWGSWSVALGGYLNGKMSGPHIGVPLHGDSVGSDYCPDVHWSDCGPLLLRPEGSWPFASNRWGSAGGLWCHLCPGGIPGGRGGGRGSLCVADGFDAHLRHLLHAVDPVDQHRRLQTYSGFGFGAQGLYLWDRGLDPGQPGRGNLRGWRRLSEFLLYWRRLRHLPRALLLHPPGYPAQGSARRRGEEGHLWPWGFGHVQVPHFYHLRPLCVHGQYFREQLLLPVRGRLPERIRLSGTGCPDAHSTSSRNSFFMAHPSFLCRPIRP